MSLTTGYDFLHDFEFAPQPRFSRAHWLHSEFNDHLWNIKTCQQNPIIIDWQVRLWNGTLLTDSQNITLLNSLKHLLIASVDGMNGEFTTLAAETKNIRLKCSMRTIDYLLIHAQELQLVELGMAALDFDDMKLILDQLSSSSRSEDSIYDWHNRATAFFKEKLRDFTEHDAEKYFLKYSAMSAVSEDQLEGYELDIPVETIPRLRAALMEAGFYYRNNVYGFAVNTKKLSQHLYSDTLRGKHTQKTTFDALSFFPNEPIHKREYPAVAVTTGKSERLQETYLFYYRYFFTCSAMLETLGLPSPANTDLLSDYSPKTGVSARFRSVPSDVLLSLFRKSTEFHIEHGRNILNGFIRVAAHCQKNRVSMHQLGSESIRRIVGPTLIKLGVKKLGLSCFRKSSFHGTRKENIITYYKNLRANHGLLELVHVYIGSVQLIVGMIMARRMDELVTLNAKTCLDTSRSWLIFRLGKSTKKALGLRQRESRPIDAIAAEMIEELRRFQKILKRVGVIDDMTDLFSTPYLLGYGGLNKASRYQYNRCFDFVCDYFDTPLTSAGKRYYIRQHQLRRFFAMMFFYSNSFGDLDTLRWMLGHRDIEHVWRYLTECLTPKEIHGAGARYFTELAKSDRLDNYKNLQELLAARFGTDRFSLVDEQKIEQYLVNMFEEGKAHIEPQFFKDENGKSMRVLFIVS